MKIPSTYTLQFSINCRTHADRILSIIFILKQIISFIHATGLTLLFRAWYSRYVFVCLKCSKNPNVLSVLVITKTSFSYTQTHQSSVLEVHIDQLVTCISHLLSIFFHSCVYPKLRSQTQYSTEKTQLTGSEGGCRDTEAVG